MLIDCQKELHVVAELGLQHPLETVVSTFYSSNSFLVKPLVLLHRTGYEQLNSCPQGAPTQGLAESGQWLPSYTSTSASSAQRDRCGLLGHNLLCWSRDNTLKKPSTGETCLVSFSSLRDHCLLLHAVQCLKAVASHIFCPVLWLKQQGQSCINYSVIARSGSLPWSQ